MRLFAAISFDEETLDAIERVSGEIPVGSVVQRENLHLTLSFMGEVSSPTAVAIDEALSGVVMSPFGISPLGLGTFGTSAPSVLWMGLRKSPELDALHGKIRSALHGAGVSVPRERFRPHITLARFSRGLGSGDAARLAAFLSAWGAVELSPCVVTGFGLFQSHLRSDGAWYEELSRYDFGGAFA